MDDPGRISRLLNDKMDKISIQIENAKLADYVDLMKDKKRLLWNNFVAGLARGFGMAVGFTILGGVIIYFLRYLVLLNLPIIGNFISELVRIVQNNL
jgi:hypothetical protein